MDKRIVDITLDYGVDSEGHIVDNLERAVAGEATIHFEDGTHVMRPFNATEPLAGTVAA